MTESVSFAFDRGARVQPKDEPGTKPGKVVGLHVDKAGTRSYLVRTINHEGDSQTTGWWDESELEAAPTAAATAPKVDEKHAPAIADIAHAALSAVINHPNTVAEVGKAVDAVTGSGPTAANVKAAVTAALATVAKVATSDPQVKQAAGDAAKTAAANPPTTSKVA